jgi:hypothetical protein
MEKVIHKGVGDLSPSSLKFPLKILGCALGSYRYLEHSSILAQDLRREWKNLSLKLHKCWRQTGVIKGYLLQFVISTLYIRT